MKIFRIIIFLFIVNATSFTQNTSMVLVKGGVFQPQYGVTEEKEAVVDNFYMDITPVTNQEFLMFAQKHPKWKKSQIIRLFADENYLRTWKDDTNFPEVLENSPVTNISWFAAKAYCEDQGKRLPSTNEWEFAAMASATESDARKDSVFNVRIMEMYQTPKTYFREVGKGTPNYWGIYDLNELVWEWTADFNTVMIAGENRDNNDKNLFCGAGSLNANDLMDYTAFMRYAFRNSLKAKYSINSLGFRCVK